ncbi:glycosylase [Paraflavisolibacter sp. H34]|uniref:glycosylase n=1 Tax=Huijunlia imazamoxiresistens TaxID=3127457 RepID=UPI0030171560
MRTIRNFFTSSLSLLLLAGSVSAQKTARTVTDSTMQAVYEQVKTPYKYGLVVAPENNAKKMDCPTVFRQDGKWYMTYVIFDGRGYETWLSSSDDLLNWKTQGRLMSFTDSTQWDGSQKAGYPALQEPTWGGNYKLQKYKKQYWMPYFGGAKSGYEAGDLAISMAFTSKKPSTAHEWKRLPQPIFTSKDVDVRWWENKKLFKPTVIWDKEKTTGYPFVMYYNANGDSNANRKSWYERIGMAVSEDMVHWKRFQKEPVMDHFTGITGDAVFQKMGDLWVMFYFGAFWGERKDAYNRFACSYDLVNWTDWKGDDLIKASEPYDNRFAHKSYVVHHNGVTYHFYCAVNTADQRGIAVATSKDLGKSSVNFVAAAK